MPSSAASQRAGTPPQAHTETGTVLSPSLSPSPPCARACPPSVVVLLGSKSGLGLVNEKLENREQSHHPTTSRRTSVPHPAPLPLPPHVSKNLNLVADVEPVLACGWYGNAVSHVPSDTLSSTASPRLLGRTNNASCDQMRRLVSRTGSVLEQHL